MSAVPENIAELWKEPNDVAMVNAILASARHGLVVLANESPQFDASVHALFAPSLQDLARFEQQAPTKPVAIRPENYPLLVLDIASLGPAACERIVQAVPSLLPVVLLCDEATSETDYPVSEQIVATIRNNELAGQAWQDFRAQREENHGKLVVLDFQDKARSEPLCDYLIARHFQVVTASERFTTTFSRSHVGSQLLVLEALMPATDELDYLYRLRLSHESDALGIAVSSGLTDSATRCALLDAGADDLLDTTMSHAEIALRLQALSRQQTRAQQIRSDAYRFPGSVAYNADFLFNVGNKLYASAQRDVMTMALAMISVSFAQTESTAKLSSKERIDVLQLVANYCTRNLRETDLFAQCGERDFIALVTCVGRNNIARVFNRLSEEVVDLVDRSTQGRASVRLNIGATPELGVSFNSMMTRAQQALAKAEKDTDSWLVIN